MCRSFSLMWPSRVICLLLLIATLWIGPGDSIVDGALCPSTIQSVCPCETLSTGLSIDCPGTVNITDLIQKLEEDGTAVQRLNVKDAPVGILRNSTFGKVLIRQLNLAGNRITSVERGAFASQAANLEGLDLSNNALSSLPNLVSMPKLSNLNVADNQIESINQGAFDSMPLLTTLDLSRNTLSTLPQGVLPKQVATILLQGNPWMCDNNMDWFIKYLMSSNVRTALPDQTDVTCAGPPQYAGVPMKDLTSKKANDTIATNTMKKSSFAQNANNLLPLASNLLPGLNSLGGGSSAFGGPSAGLDFLSGLARNLPGGNFIPPPAVSSGSSGAAASGSGSGGVGAANPLGLMPGGNGLASFSRPLGQLIAGNKGPAQIQDLLSSIPNLMQSLPGGDLTNIDLSKVPPELIKYVMNGGQIPGLPPAMLTNYISQYLQKMATAAEQANSGVTNDMTAKMLPPLDKLPMEMINRVVSGDPLPGLTPEQTNAIKQYYLTQKPSATSADDATTKGSKSGSSEHHAVTIKGLPADQMLKRLPPGFDLTRLPPQLMQQVAVGKPIDLSLLPPDMLDAFKQHNPDLAADIDRAIQEANGGSADTSADNVTVSTSAATPATVPADQTTVAYDINHIDRQSDLKLPDPSADSRTMVYTGLGLGFVALLSIAILAYFCYRRRNATEDQMEDVYQTKSFAVGGRASSTPNYGYENNNAMATPPQSVCFSPITAMGPTNVIVHKSLNSTLSTMPHSLAFDPYKSHQQWIYGPVPYKRPEM